MEECTAEITCFEWSGFLEDDYAGNYYHQIEGTNEYVGYSYET